MNIEIILENTTRSCFTFQGTVKVYFLTRLPSCYVLSFGMHCESHCFCVLNCCLNGASCFDCAYFHRSHSFHCCTTHEMHESLVCVLIPSCWRPCIPAVFFPLTPTDIVLSVVRTFWQSSVLENLSTSWCCHIGTEWNVMKLKEMCILAELFCLRDSIHVCGWSHVEYSSLYFKLLISPITSKGSRCGDGHYTTHRHLSSVMFCLTLRLSNRNSRGTLEAKKKADNRLRMWLCLWGLQVSNADICYYNAVGGPKRVALKEVADICSFVVMASPFFVNFGRLRPRKRQTRIRYSLWSLNC
jgi:hypothetical protein